MDGKPLKTSFGMTSLDDPGLRAKQENGGWPEMPTAYHSRLLSAIG
jgi:hypothetical protein